MRILIASTHRAIVGGVETYLRDLIPALRNRGHETALLCEHHGPDGEEGIDAGIPGLPIWCASAGDLPTVLSQVAAWRPDVVYVQGLESPALEEELLERFPAVMFAHNYHGACISGTKRFAVPVMQPCKRPLGIGCLLNYYPRRCGGLSPLTMARQYQREKRRKALLSRYRTILVASNHMREEYLRQGVPGVKLRLAPLFPAGQRPSPLPPADRAPAGCVLMVGRLTDLKGGRFLIMAMRRAAEELRRPLRLVVAGDGPERGRLEVLARRLGVPTQFMGKVGPGLREQLMREADVLAVPSVWPEPFGLVGIEAGCVGLPAVGFAVGGIPDWLIPGKSGELAPGDPPTAWGLAQALVRVFADAKYLGQLSVGAWEIARNYTREAHVRRLEEILKQASIGSLVDAAH